VIASHLRLFASVAVAAAIMAPAAATNAQQARRYIVQFKSEVAFDEFTGAYTDDARFNAAHHRHHSRGVLGALMALERRHGFRADAVFSVALRGFAGPLTPGQLRRLGADPLVASIEPDDLISLSPDAAASQIVDWGITRIGADLSSTHSGDGAGEITNVHIYVIDTGVDATHPDLNVVQHVSMIGEPNADCNGHGTGVAGIIAARDNGDFTVGVVPGAPIHGVKVLTCQGFTFPSFIIQGVDWVTANAVKPAVVNMSLGSLIPFTAMNTAVLNSAATGLVYAIAAGNGNPFNNNQPLNACNTSPAGAGYDSPWFNGVITVAATDDADVEASFSNYGPCVNLWAPGVDVTTTWLTGAGGTFTGSGTSFASPYVAGGAALLLSRAPTLVPWQVELLLRLVADVPGTTSLDGAAIRRLQIKYF
jgi:subtilisin family serine protease